MDLCGICTGISCLDGHVRSGCTATEQDFIGAAAVTVGCRWAETMRPRAIYTFGSIAAVLVCIFSATAMADCLISTQSGTMAKLLALEAPDTDVSNIDVRRSCISIKR